MWYVNDKKKINATVVSGEFFFTHGRSYIYFLIVTYI